MFKRSIMFPPDCHCPSCSGFRGYSLKPDLIQTLHRVPSRSSLSFLPDHHCSSFPTDALLPSMLQLIFIPLAETHLYSLRQKSSETHLDRLR